MKHLVIVDDELGSRQSLHAVFSGEYKVMLADSAKTALTLLNDFRADLVMLDYMMPEMDGVTLLKEIQSRYPDVPFIMVSASSTVRPVVDAMRAGAFDFVSKPFDVQEIRAVVARAIEHSGLKRKVEVLQGELASRFPLNAIIGTSPKMQQVLEVVRRSADTDATILIHGESGTGKELIARQLHSLSSRCDEPFVPVHCGSLPDSLMESELFGHEKGAFTGADRRKPGRFDMAGSGTIFFDEVSEMSAATQVKLLRVIQEREYMRVGGTQVLRTNARIVTASNKDLMNEVREQRFREDLYYRLNVIPVTMPPVRERREDIPLLVDYFIQTIRQNMNIAMEEVSPETMELLVNYDWPGNVREVRNVIERAMVLHGHQRTLPPESLPSEFRNAVTITIPGKHVSVEEPPEVVTSLQDAVHEYERKLVMNALRRANGVQTRAAELLGTTRRILKYRMDKLNISDNQNGVKKPDASAAANEDKKVEETKEAAAESAIPFYPPAEEAPPPQSTPAQTEPELTATSSEQPGAEIIKDEPVVSPDPAPEPPQSNDEADSARFVEETKPVTTPAPGTEHIAVEYSPSYQSPPPEQLPVHSISSYRLMDGGEFAGRIIY